MRAIALVLVFSAAAAGIGQAQRGPGPGQGPGERDRIEQQLRERMSDVVQRRLDLNSQQVQQLRDASRRFDRDRIALLSQERRVRMAIRDQIEAGENGSQPRIAALLDSAILLERKRLDVIEAEQKQLATFLTPRQRAQYFGLQTQMRRHLEELRRRREPPPGGRRMPPL